MKRWRTIVKIAIFVVVVISLGIHTGWGTYSSLGFGFIASVCPLGALEGIFGSWAFVPRLVIGLVAMLLIVFLLGRAFCAWVCPVPPLSSFFRRDKTRKQEQKLREEAGRATFKRYEEAKAALSVNSELDSSEHASAKGETENGSVQTPIENKSIPQGEIEPVRLGAKIKLDSRHLVLCGALGSAAIFGFPVFCLVCPIGLSCATLVLLMRLMGVGELSWGLLIFPLIIIAELTFLRPFCEKICPVSALMSLIGRFNKTFRPSVNKEVCLRSSKAHSCHACSSACPIHIDPRNNMGNVSEIECTRCGECFDACPAQAISFPVIRQEKNYFHSEAKKV